MHHHHALKPLHLIWLILTYFGHKLGWLFGG